MSAEVGAKVRRAAGSTWAPAIAAAIPIAALVLCYGLRNHYAFGDESIGTFGGRQVIADFPHALWDPNFSSRPLERMLAWAWAVCFELAPTTTGAFQMAHVMQAAAAASLTVPVALLARGVGVSRWWSVGAGVLAAVGPFAVAGTTLLNNSAGVTAMAWVLVAGQRAVTRPGWRSDALLLVAGLVAGLVRGGNLPLVAGVAPAIVLAAWSRSPGIAGVAKEMARRHLLLLLAAVAAAGLLAVRGFAGLFGTYGAGRSTYLPWDVLLPGIKLLGGHMAVGTGIIALAFAGPWVVRAIVRATDDAERSFGLTAFSVSLIFVYVYAPALNEDRYFLVLTPLVAVAFVHAVTVRRLGIGWLLAGVAALAFLLDRGMDWPDTPDAFVVMPTSQWWNRVISGRLSELPLYHGWMAAAGAALVALAVGALLLGRGRWSPTRTVVLGVMFGAMMSSQIAGAVYNMDQWTKLRGRPDVSFGQLTAIDRALPGDDTALLLRSNPTDDPLVAFNWNYRAYFNQKLYGTLDVGEPAPCCLGPHIPLTWDATDGAVTVPVPSRYVATPLTPTAAFAGRTLAGSVAEGFRVDVVAQPPRLAFMAGPITNDSVSLTVWPRAAGRAAACLTGDYSSVLSVRVDDRAATVAGAGAVQSLRLPDHERTTVVFRSRKGTEPYDLRLGACPPGIA